MKKEYVKPEAKQLLLSGQDVVTASTNQLDVTGQDVGWDASLLSTN